jgi:sugar-specific transcriptional regulator TrmB
MSKTFIQIQENLLQFRLTNNEAKIIIALTRFGAMTILELSQNADLARTSIYHYIEKLSRRGIVSIVIDNYTKKYKVVDPDELKNILVNTSQKSIDKTTEDLKSIQNNNYQSNEITITKGIANIKKVYTSFLSCKDKSEYLVKGGNYHEWLNLDLDFFEKFEKQRGVFFEDIRLLLNPSQKLSQATKVNHQNNMKIKILPVLKPILTTMVLVDQKIIITEMKPPYNCIIIKNDFLYAMEKQEFEVLWDLL